MEAKRYPNRLIPKICWLHNIDIHNLIRQECDVYVARRIDGRREECVDEEFGSENAFLKSDALKNSDVPEMSLSLLGALFNPEDLRYRQIRRAMEDWDGRRVRDEALTEECVVECPNPWFAVAWNVAGLHDQTVPYKKEFSREKEYKKFVEEINRVSDVIKMEFEEYRETVNPLVAITKLKHSPSFLNYWHFLFEIFPMGSEKPMVETKSNWEKDLADKVAKQCLRYGFQYVDDLHVTQLSPSLWRKGFWRCLRTVFG